MTSSPSFDGGTIRPVISARLAVVCLGALAVMLVVFVPRMATASSPGRAAASADAASSTKVSAAGSARCNPNRLIAGRWPTRCWRPYKATSPFNQPIPNGARVAPDSAQIVAKLMSFGPVDNLVVGQADTPDDYSHPVYFSRRSDPVFRLHCSESWGRCSIEGKRIRVPDAARPAAGDDGHMTVITPTGWEYDFWRVESKPRGGGTLVSSWGGRTRIRRRRPAVRWHSERLRKRGGNHPRGRAGIGADQPRALHDRAVRRRALGVPRGQERRRRAGLVPVREPRRWALACSSR